MEIMMSLEILGMAIVASGFGGWIAGNLNGANQAEFSEGKPDESDLLCSLAPAPKVLPAAPKSEAENSQRASGNWSSFGADMPPLAEVRSQARQILQTDDVWNAPDIGEQLDEFMRSGDRRSINVLANYRSSIEALQRANDAVPSAFDTGERLQFSPYDKPHVSRASAPGALPKQQSLPFAGIW